MARTLRTLAFAAAVALVATACTVKKTEAPVLSGPSELGLSILVQATPDILTQDGTSQSTVTVLARDGSGQPVKNLTCRVDTILGDKVADYGALSSKTLTTGSDGRGVVIYTAPAPSLVGVQTEVTFAVTPIGDNYLNAAVRTASLKLVPSGTITPTGGAAAVFTYKPDAPVEGDQVVFSVKFCTGSSTDACTPTATTGFTWSFGDGALASGTSVGHAFGGAGSYPVTLTLYDAKGFPSSGTQAVVVKASAAPVASFTMTPSSPKVAAEVVLDGSASAAATGRTIVGYEWSFGDGTGKRTSLPYTTHDWTTAGNYAVSLTVTDDLGKTSTKVLAVTVTP
jgi:PKD repeat protein